MWACILLPSVSEGWLDVGHCVCFIGHCVVNLSQTASFAMLLLEFVVLTELGHMGNVSTRDETVTWSTGDAVHSASQMSLLGDIFNV